MEAGEELREVESFPEIDRAGVCTCACSGQPLGCSDPFFSEGVSTKYRGENCAGVNRYSGPTGHRAVVPSLVVGSCRYIAVSSALALSCGTVSTLVSRPLNAYFLDFLVHTQPRGDRAVEEAYKSYTRRGSCSSSSSTKCIVAPCGFGLAEPPHCHRWKSPHRATLRALHLTRSQW